MGAWNQFFFLECNGWCCSEPVVGLSCLKQPGAGIRREALSKWHILKELLSLQTWSCGEQESGKGRKRPIRFGADYAACNLSDTFVGEQWGVIVSYCGRVKLIVNDCFEAIRLKWPKTKVDA